MVSCEMICGGTTQLNWVRVHDSGLLGNSNSNIALTGSSSCEASIKDTLTGSTDSTHTKVSPEIATYNILYISELQWNLIITSQVLKVVRYYRVLYYTNYSCLVAAER